MPDAKQLVQLATKLTELTQQGKVVWEETAQETEFLTALPAYGVRISHEIVGQNWGDDVFDYRLTILDEKGRVLETITDRKIYDDTYKSDLLSGLYELARRSALNVDDRLIDLLSGLQKLG